ncbi:MAG: PorT family protein [Chlorobi bacterium]|nr:PorT family protein [Chlorobiota bacterium]
MKNTLFPLLTAIILGISTHAQDIAIGGKLGGNLSSFYNKKGTQYSFLFGLNLGVINHYKIKNHFYLITELNYERKGGYMLANGITPFWDQNFTTKLNYISLPILAKITIGRAECFYFNGGPFVSYLFSATERSVLTESSTGELVSDDTQNFTTLYKRFDFGLGLGLGVSIDIYEQMKLIFDTRYNISFIPLLKDSHYSNIKNHSINLNCGVLFILKNKKSYDQ